MFRNVTIREYLNVLEISSYILKYDYYIEGKITFDDKISFIACISKNTLLVDFKDNITIWTLLLLKTEIHTVD